MTLKEVIEYVSDIKPNAFSEETLTKWINECEGDVQTEILCIAPEDIVTYKYSDNADTELIVGAPHDKIYGLYLLAMIDFSHGEYSKYENTMQLFNAARTEFAKWFIRTHKREVEDARGYYISAYGLAKKHGFVGTEEEWIKSLKGEQGPRGEKGDPGRDGWSPVVVFEEIDTGCKMIVQDYTGTKSVEIMDGKTPQKGEDYFTPEEVEDVKQHILDNTGISGKEDKANKVLSLDEDFMDQTFDDEKYPSVNAVKTVFGTVLSETSKAVSDGTNYAIEESKAYTNDEIEKFNFIKIENELPETGSPNKIYLVPKTDTQEKDLFDEYLWVDNKWEWISTKSIDVDFTNYYSKNEIDAKISSIYKFMGSVDISEITMSEDEVSYGYAFDSLLEKCINGYVYNLRESGNLNSKFMAQNLIDRTQTLYFSWNNYFEFGSWGNFGTNNGFVYPSWKEATFYWSNPDDQLLITVENRGTVNQPDWQVVKIEETTYQNLEGTGVYRDSLPRLSEANEDGTYTDFYSVYLIKLPDLYVNEGDNVAWTDWGWDVLAGTVDLSNYYDREEIDDMFADVGGGATEEKWELLQSKDITEEDGEIDGLVINFPEGYKEYGVRLEKTASETTNNTIIYPYAINDMGQSGYFGGFWDSYEGVNSTTHDLTFSSMMLKENNAIKLEGILNSEKIAGKPNNKQTSGWISGYKRWEKVRFNTKLPVGSKYRVWGLKI